MLAISPSRICLSVEAFVCANAETASTIQTNTENKGRFAIIFNRNLHSALFRLQRVSYSICNLIQFLTFGFVSIMRAKPHTESITHVGNYERMPGIDGLMVQKSRAAIIPINHADLKLA